MSGVNEIFVIRREGELGHREMWELRQAIHEAVGRGIRRVVLDLSRVDHVAYPSLGTLVERAGRLRAVGGDLKIVGASPYLKKIFRFAGVFPHLATYETVDEALSAFEAEEEGVRTTTVSAGSSGSWVLRML
ncbi:MAG: STAS domain-containing protein [Deltaproteobacteria bacterium]|nr:MAG: STAS domain-containing protein [Deltaproteobacteria bacterium]